ncbi:PaaI family thioesterase [Amycolatopsis nigrescens]|uniref:PaaI family thioesterase n=1 Tax=Amycolatopsis nigrescens TaxID=381445 RepID=UPI00037C4056|nr:PaaI family thioesterase [Amycolatopsis nigrescens]
MTDSTDAAALFRTMPFADVLGIEGLEHSAALVRARLGWQESLCTLGGGLHGGALMALADSTGAVCAFLNLPEGAAGTTTIESKTNFLRAVRDGHATASSRPLHAGRKVIVVETEIHDEAGKLVAKVTQSQAVL